jgi:hypothetical protein
MRRKTKEISKKKTKKVIKNQMDLKNNQLHRN